MNTIKLMKAFNIPLLAAMNIESVVEENGRTIYERLDDMAEILEANGYMTYGVESVHFEVEPNALWEPVRTQMGDAVYCEYLNTGDSYKPTILYDTFADEFIITSWGDFVEGLEQSPMPGVYLWDGGDVYIIWHDGFVWHRVFNGKSKDVFVQVELRQDGDALQCFIFNDGEFITGYTAEHTNFWNHGVNYDDEETAVKVVRFCIRKMIETAKQWVVETEREEVIEVLQVVADNYKGELDNV